jgi:hypothetical protein
MAMLPGSFLDPDKQLMSEEPISSAFASCQRLELTLASSDGGWDDHTWQNFKEEREWMQGAAFRREGE